MSLRILPAFPDLLVDGERVLLFAGIASVYSAAVGFVHGLTSLLSRRRCGRAADKFAALESSSARTFSASAMSKYSFTRIGTITPSMNAFKSGSIPTGLRCFPNWTTVAIRTVGGRVHFIAPVDNPFQTPKCRG